MSQQEQFLHFLLEAKKHTYASQGDEATVQPLIPGSKQLEWYEGGWLYRDIYFGMTYFVGQETVSFQQRPFWSMSYAGGIIAAITSPEEIRAIYNFLRGAMRQVTLEHPYRGPAKWQQGAYCYTDEHKGSLHAFWGHEIITFQAQPVYVLRYSGGLLR
ncbi:MAG TPA: DUF5680 domain-containing protein [Ktedonobacteraceae bacterium]|nr:DUF5680 domain-containing protein [Ktedonobacteraceae bacterium]